MRREMARFGELLAWGHLNTAVARSHFTNRLDFPNQPVIALACLSCLPMLETSARKPQ